MEGDISDQGCLMIPEIIQMFALTKFVLPHMAKGEIAQTFCMQESKNLDVSAKDKCLSAV